MYDTFRCCIAQPQGDGVCVQSSQLVSMAIPRLDSQHAGIAQDRHGAAQPAVARAATWLPCQLTRFLKGLQCCQLLLQHWPIATPTLACVSAQRLQVVNQWLEGGSIPGCVEQPVGLNSLELPAGALLPIKGPIGPVKVTLPDVPARQCNSSIKTCRRQGLCVRVRSTAADQCESGPEHRNLQIRPTGAARAACR